MSATIQDRTSEFRQCVTNFNRLNRDRPKKNAPQPSKSAFSKRAADIARDIATATDLLKKLAELAKKKPLFDDRPVEITELTHVIKQGIFRIEGKLKALQTDVASGAVPATGATSVFLKNVLQLLNTQTKNVSGEFKDVLEMRQKNEIESKERTNQFLLSTRAMGTESASDNPFLLAVDSEPGVSVPSDNPYLLIPDQTQQMALLEEQSQEYLQERNRAVETIESTINEVGNLFQQLASMVSEQGEMVQRIDMDVDDIDMNIQGAQRELLKYFNGILNNRWLFLKVFGVLIFFFLLWVLVS